MQDNVGRRNKTTSRGSRTVDHPPANEQLDVPHFHGVTAAFDVIWQHMQVLNFCRNEKII